MKGFRFYAESRLTVAKLTARANAGERVECLALDISESDGRAWRYNPGAVSVALTGDPGSLGYGVVSLEYLAKRCKRIPEPLARRLHPELFVYLERE